MMPVVWGWRRTCWSSRVCRWPLCLIFFLVCRQEPFAFCNLRSMYKYGQTWSQEQLCAQTAQHSYHSWVYLYRFECFESEQLWKGFLNSIHSDAVIQPAFRSVKKWDTLKSRLYVRITNVFSCQTNGGLEYSGCWGCLRLKGPARSIDVRWLRTSYPVVLGVQKHMCFAAALKP